MKEPSSRPGSRDSRSGFGADLRYLDALDAGDLETVARLWERAETDPELEKALGELTDGLAQEEGPDPSWKADVTRVKDLLRQYLPSAFAAPAPLSPLTVGDVAARLQADSSLGGRLSGADQASNARLLGSTILIPDQLGQPHLDRWQKSLGISASAAYWRAFRQAAVLLAMARCQQNTELAAARPAARPSPGGRS